jgi:hypothetical protein
MTDELREVVSMPPHLASLASYLEQRLHQLHPQHTFVVSLRDDERDRIKEEPHVDA